MATLIQPPYQVFTDVDGDPLENGYIYIGVEGLNPISNPQQAYWDAGFTIPAVNIRTKGGYPVRTGSPGRLYVSSKSYSITVLNKNNTLVYSNLKVVDNFNIPSDLDLMITVDTIADLRDYPIPTATTTVQVLGYLVVGDGGGGPIRVWKTGAAPGTYVDNGSRIIVPTGGDGSSAWMWEYSGPVPIAWYNNDILLANADQDIKEIELAIGENYALAAPLNMRPGLILGTNGSFDQAGLTFQNLAKITVAGIADDAIKFSSGDAGAELKGVFLDCSAQVGGDGISFLTGAEVRNMCRLTNIVILNPSARGIYEQEQYKGNVFENVYVIGAGSHGIESQALDAYRKRIWCSECGGHGIYLPRPASGDAGGNRYEDTDCWANTLSGIVEEQAGDTWIRTQVDLNQEEGLILRNRANNNAFIGIKLRSGDTGAVGTYSAILFEDGATSGPFGNILSDIQAIDGGAYHTYVIEDTCATPVNNIISNLSVSLDGGGFASGIFSPSVRRGSTINGVTHVPATGGVSTYLYPVMKEGQENLLLNGTFDRLHFDSYPSAWTKSISNITFVQEAGVHSRFMGKATSSGAGTFESIRQFVFDVDKIKGKVVHLTGYAMAPATNTLNLCTISIFADAVPTEQAIPNDGVWHPINIRASIGGAVSAVRIQATMTGGVATANEIIYIDELALTFNDIPLTSQHRLEGTLDFGTFASTDATPSVRGKTRWKTANAAPTTITNFDDGYQGQQVLIVFGDANTTVDFSANSNLNGNAGVDFVAAVGDSMLAISDGSVWYCFVSKN